MFEAYKSNGIIYSYYKTKEFLKTLERWKAPHATGLAIPGTFGPLGAPTIKTASVPSWIPNLLLEPY
jgi:hypothetical protein